MLLSFDTTKYNIRSIELQIKQFLDSIKGLSDNTHRAYEQTLRQLDSKIKGKEPMQKDILKFLKRYQASSLNRHKTAIKAYLKFKGEVWQFTTQQFSPTTKKVPPYVDPDIVKKIIETADNEDDRMFICTLFTLGCTINELMRIERKDISRSIVKVSVKGATTRKKPIVEDFYKKISKHARKKDGKIFPRPYSYYYAHLRSLAKEAGLGEATSVMIKNARVVDLLNKGMALPFVQKFSGDAPMKTIAISLSITSHRLTTDELIDELEKAERRGIAT